MITNKICNEKHSVCSYTEFNGNSENVISNYIGIAILVVSLGFVIKILS